VRSEDMGGAFLDLEEQFDDVRLKLAG
jgi:hypothetical protein